MMQAYDSGWESAYSGHDSANLWSEEPVPCVDAAIEELTRRGCRTVLDVGCGDGRNLLRLVEAGFACAGLDVSATGLRRAADRLSGSSFLIRGEATVMGSIADGSVDAITCFDVIGQIPDTRGALSCFSRVLVAGGVVVTNAFTPQDSEYGNGNPAGRHTFEYKGTLFRFFEEEDIRELFSDWEIHRLYRQAWTDPPHGAFRPYEHTHDNWIVIASAPA